MHINSFQHYYWNVNMLNFNDLCKFSSDKIQSEPLNF